MLRRGPAVVLDAREVFIDMRASCVAAALSPKCTPGVLIDVTATSILASSR